MKCTISTAIDSIIANSFLSRMHISMGKSIIIIEKERLIRERSSQEKYASGKLSQVLRVHLFCKQSLETQSSHYVNVSVLI